MLDTILDTIFNGVLISTSAYAMFALNPLEHRFAFASSAVAFCHGCTGVYTRFFDNSCGAEGKYMNRVKKLTTSCMEITSVPLINMHLYRSSLQTNALALGHGSFIIPLAFDVAFICFGTDEDGEESTAILKDLTVLGNIVSLLFFAFNESNLTAGIMALSAFFAYYGSTMIEDMLHGTGEYSSLAGYSLFFGLLPLAICTSSGTAAI